MPKLLFICTGNTCRSPMAEHLFRQLVAGDPELREEWEVASAGISVHSGQWTSRQAASVLRERDIDLREHSSRQLNREMVEKADLLLTMTRAHKQRVLQLVPEAGEKVFTLREYAGMEPGADIEDPFGQAEPVYRQVRDEILNSLRKVIERLKEEKGSN